jgi:hypothetical protein
VEKKVWKVILVLLLCGLVVWLTDSYLWRVSEAYEPGEAVMANDMVNTYTLMEHGALHLEDAGAGYVGIGYGGTDRGTYTDEQGITRKGLVAWLDMVTAESPSSDGPTSREVVEVHDGQIVTFGGYKIEVIDIWRKGGLFRGSFWIKLAVSPEEAAK